MRRKAGRILFSRWWLLLAITAVGVSQSGCFYVGRGGGWHHHDRW